MPALAPNAQKLSVANILQVTQYDATTASHYEAVQELIRVTNMAKQQGSRGQVAKKFLSELRIALLAAGAEIVVKSKHSFLPDAYLCFISPRFMEVPDDPRALVLRFKLGNTKKAPFVCLELRDKNGTCLPWTTIDSREDGYKKCGKSFANYTALVRHLATRHVVLWLSFLCPWCSYCGFEKAKATRHVVTCKFMPVEVISVVEAVELHASPAEIFHLINAASKHLKEVRAHDAKHGLKTRITLAMTRSQGVFRAYAESTKAGRKKQWPKSVKPNTKGYHYDDDGTSIFSERFGKFPFFIRCVGCLRVMMDTEVASLSHLVNCGVMGFMTYHSQKLLDDGVVSETDRRVLQWKENAEDSLKNFQPTISCTVDGFGANSRDNPARRKLKKVMKKVSPKDGYRAKLFSIKDEENDLSGNLRIIGTISDQGKLKTELTEKVLKLSAFNNLVRKRKMSIDVASNQKKKCARRTSPDEMLIDVWTERVEAEIDDLEVVENHLLAETDETESGVEIIEMLD